MTSNDPPDNMSDGMMMNDNPLAVQICDIPSFVAGAVFVILLVHAGVLFTIALRRFFAKDSQLRQVLRDARRPVVSASHFGHRHHAAHFWSTGTWVFASAMLLGLSVGSCNIFAGFFQDNCTASTPASRRKVAILCSPSALADRLVFIILSWMWLRFTQRVLQRKPNWLNTLLVILAPVFVAVFIVTEVVVVASSQIARSFAFTIFSVGFLLVLFLLALCLTLLGQLWIGTDAFVKLTRAQRWHALKLALVVLTYVAGGLSRHLYTLVEMVRSEQPRGGRYQDPIAQTIAQFVPIELCLIVFGLHGGAVMPPSKERQHDAVAARNRNERLEEGHGGRELSQLATCSVDGAAPLSSASSSQHALLSSADDRQIALVGDAAVPRIPRIQPALPRSASVVEPPPLVGSSVLDVREASLYRAASAFDRALLPADAPSGLWMSSSNANDIEAKSLAPISEAHGYPFNEQRRGSGEQSVHLTLASLAGERVTSPPLSTAPSDKYLLPLSRHESSPVILRRHVDGTSICMDDKAFGDEEDSVESEPPQWTPQHRLAHAGVPSPDAFGSAAVGCVSGGGGVGEDCLVPPPMQAEESLPLHASYSPMSPISVNAAVTLRRATAGAEGQTVHHEDNDEVSSFEGDVCWNPNAVRVRGDDSTLDTTAVSYDWPTWVAARPQDAGTPRQYAGADDSSLGSTLPSVMTRSDTRSEHAAHSGSRSSPDDDSS